MRSLTLKKQPLKSALKNPKMRETQLLREVKRVSFNEVITNLNHQNDDSIIPQNMFNQTSELLINNEIAIVDQSATI